MKKEGQLDFVFELYMPFRNQLRKLELFDALYVIWGFARNLTFDLLLPHDIARPHNYDQRGSLDKRRYRGLNDYELEFLYKELLLHAVPDMPAKNSLKKLDTLAKLINYVRHGLANEIDKRRIGGRNVMIDFNRIFHQQFKWQKGYKQNAIFRYYKVFSAPEVEALVMRAYGLSTWELFMLGFFFFRLSGDEFKLRYPYPSLVGKLSNEMVAKFFLAFSTNLADIRPEIAMHQEMNENLMYAYNPLAIKPILVHQDFFVCPVPLLLFWQVTSGTYYAIVKEKGFNHAFGGAFESYIGEVIAKINNGRFTVSPEVIYGKPEKRSVDWLIEEPGNLLFVECKAKRMTLNAKTKAGLTESLTADLHKMADFVFQLYKTFLDYQSGNYPHRPYDPNLIVYLLVVTFDPWYLEYNTDLWQLVKDQLIVLFLANDLDVALLESHPFHITSAEEFESDLQLMHEIGIDTYYKLWERNELYDLVQQFEYRNLFHDEFKKTFLDPLK